MNLNEAPKNRELKITDIFTTPSVKKRLGDMGITIGAKITAVKKAPFGDTLEIKSRGTFLALRGTVAEKIFVEVIS